MQLEIIWIIAIVVFGVLEAVTYQLVSIWFAIGAVGGLIARLLGFDFAVQMTVFLAFAALSLCCLRPVSMKWLKPKIIKTNVDALSGKEILITQTVDNINGSGKGKINGMTWTVRSADNSVIEKDSLAVIERIEGVKLIVKTKGE